MSDSDSDFEVETVIMPQEEPKKARKPRQPSEKAKLASQTNAAKARAARAKKKEQREKEKSETQALLDEIVAEKKAAKIARSQEQQNASPPSEENPRIPQENAPATGKCSPATGGERPTKSQKKKPPVSSSSEDSDDESTDDEVALVLTKHNRKGKAKSKFEHLPTSILEEMQKKIAAQEVELAALKKAPVPQENARVQVFFGGHERASKMDMADAWKGFD